MEGQEDFDPVIDRLQRLVQRRRLERVQRSSHYGTPALKVDGKAFVRVLDASTIVLHCPLEQKVLLMEISPEIYFETDHYVGYDAVLIRLNSISDEELELRLADAWQYQVKE